MQNENMIKRLVNLVETTDLSYNEDGKTKFHMLARRVLRDVAAGMELAEGTYDIRSNKGGIAVSGEVTLHGEHIYIQLGEGINFGDGKQFMYRYCEHKRDYTGGMNRWMHYRMLLRDFQNAVLLFDSAAKNKI